MEITIAATSLGYSGDSMIKWMKIGKIIWKYGYHIINVHPIFTWWWWPAGEAASYY